MSEVVEQLLKALGSIDESPRFCVSGSVDPVLPGLEVAGVGTVGIPVNPSTAQQLIEHASQAPYGRGEETIVDTSVRRVWQIEPKQLANRNPQWGSLVEGIVKGVRSEFDIKGEVTAELYKPLIYEKGSFFAPHRDTEKVEGMFATLVVCLPSRHQGGTLIVSHDQQSREIDFGGPQGEYQVQYAAFCADCRELQQFLRDPVEQVHRFRVAKHRRQHLHNQISSHGCDMTHVTDHTGSPQTLVCTKNRASYERKKAELASNEKLLTELRGLDRPRRKK